VEAALQLSLFLEDPTLTMAQNWKKEAARRGYWYRKSKKKVLIQALEITSLKQLLLIHLNERHFYVNLGKWQGMEEMIVKVMYRDDLVEQKVN